MITAGSWAQEPPHPVEFIPTLYVTGAVENPKPLEAFVYQANICNTTIYKDMMVNTHVNIPSGWRPVIGVLAKLQVSTFICNDLFVSFTVDIQDIARHNRYI